MAVALSQSRVDAAASKLKGLASAPSQSKGTKADLKTTQGLRSVAGQEGVNLKLPKKGEKPKEFWSGGFIMDTFDTLNALQYGVTGILKGKGFWNGIKTRQSFSDKDAFGDEGIPGVIAGIALDIAVDPLTYIAPISVFRKIPGAVKAVQAGKRAVLATKIGDKTSDILGRAFIYRFGEDPIYKLIDEKRITSIGKSNQKIFDLTRGIAKLDSADQILIANARKAGNLESLSPELLAKAKPAFDELDNLGKMAVEEGLLSKEIWEENVGSYMARLYRTKEVSPAGNIPVPFAGKKPLRTDVSRFMKKGDIPDDVREAMGEILEAGYPTAKAMVQLTSAIENTRFFRMVDSKFSKEIAEEGMTKLPETIRLGALSGKYVPDPIFRSLNEIIRVKSPTEKLLNNMVGTFKYSKVVLNPSTHARNIASNILLNNFEGLHPARVDIYIEAAKQLKTKGKWYQEAQEQGLGLSTFAAQELRTFLTAPEVSALGKGKSAIANSLNKLSDLYESEEQFAKLAQYIYQRKLNKTAEEAWQIAERATFNYAQVTPFIRRMRESMFGFPFITFTYKSTPQVAKTIAKAPTKISNIGKIKAGIENLSDLDELTRERATEPDWVRDGFYVKLPMKDKFGRSGYFDLTYILPFGDLMGGQFFERGINRETGLSEGIPATAVKKSPFIQLVMELGKNQDFYGNKIFKDSDDTEQQLMDVFRHVVKFMAPPPIADTIPGGYNALGQRRKGVVGRTIDIETKGISGAESGGKQTRTFSQEVFRNLGIKVSPVDIETQESIADWQERQAIKTILQETGVIKEFSIPYKIKKQ